MKRDLAALGDRAFDLAVIGGGVVGAAIARDAALRGLSVALVERDDFACAASEAMSHFVHGGIRYLALGQVGMVRRSLAERGIWRRIAPLHIRPQPCLTPVAGKAYEALALRALVGAFNMIGGRNGADTGDGHRSFLDTGTALQVEPVVEMPGLRGALVYHDFRVDEPERVVLSMLRQASQHGAVVTNHVECVGLVLRGGLVAGAELLDRIGGGHLTVRARAVVNATGPWAASLATKLMSGQSGAALTVSKGVHLVTPAIAHRHAINLAGHGEHAAILPWRGFSLVGTTDDAVDDDPAGLTPTAAEVDRLRAKVARLLPAARPMLDSALASFASARALPGAVTETYRAIRDEALVDHASDGAEGSVSIYGGKWTTARHMAEMTVDRIVARLGVSARPCATATTTLAETPDGDAEGFRAAWIGRLGSWPRDEAESWIAAYGSALPGLVARFDPTGLATPEGREQARFAIAAEQEMAVSSADFARRLSRWHGIASPGVEARAAAWLAGTAKMTDARSPQAGSGETGR